MPRVRRHNRWVKAVAAGLPLLAALAPAPAAPAIMAATGAPASALEAEFTLYVGGVLFGRGHIEAAFRHDEDYRLTALMTTAGLPKTFYEAEFHLESEGRFAAGSVRPRRFVSDSRDKSSERKITLAYSADGVPRMTADPPYEPGDLSGVLPYQQMGTQDPISAMLVPVAGTDNPCGRTIPVFDGRRRYDLQLAYDGERMLTPRGAGYSGNTIVCNIRYVPVGNPERRKFTEMLRRNDDMKVWLAPFDGGRVYMPVRLQLRTPLGGAVMELTRLEEKPSRGKTAADTAAR